MGKILIKEAVGRKAGAWIIGCTFGLLAIIAFIATLYFNILNLAIAIVFFVLYITLLTATNLLSGKYDEISYGTKGIRIRDESLFGSVTSFDIPVDEMKRVSVIKVENRFLPSRKTKTALRPGREKFSDVVFWGKPSVPYREILDHPDAINSAILIEKTNGNKYALLSNDAYSTFESIKDHYPVEMES